MTDIEKTVTVKRKKFTVKRAKFVAEYVGSGNGKQAAINAKYAEKSASSIASQLLTFPEINAAIAEKRAEIAAKAGLTAEEIMREIAILVRSNVTDYRVGKNGVLRLRDGAQPGAERAVSSIQITPGGRVTRGKTHTIRMWDKMAALKLAAQYLGMITERHEHSGPGGGPIRVQAYSDGDLERIISDDSGVDSVGDPDGGGEPHLLDGPDDAG